MEMKEWSQVVCKILETFNLKMRISGMTKKVTQFRMKGVMPYAKRERRENSMR